MDLSDSIAVVTGAGSGLGAALARRLAAAGARVSVADIVLDHARAVAEEIDTAAGESGRAVAMAFDAGDETSITDLARQVECELGPCRVLCANVGVQQFGKIEDLSRADWEWVFGVNVHGTIATTRAFLPQLRQQSSKANIVITTSTSALYPCSHMAAYVSSKYALLGFAETLRLELAEEGIGVTALLPGPMATTHLQSSAAAKPEGTKGQPVFSPDTIRVVAAGASGEMLDADSAARNVLEDLEHDRAYSMTHDVNTEPIEARFKEIREAFILSRR